MTENMVKEFTPGQMVPDLKATLKMTRKKALGLSLSEVVINLRCVQSAVCYLVNKLNK